MTLELEVFDLQWVKGYEDDPSDQCAHGRVKFHVNETVFVEPSDGIWTLSAAGLYLLRTLEDSHTLSNSVTDGNLLFPCCGFKVWPIGKEKYLVVCTGCHNGINLEIILQKDAVTIKFNDKEEKIGFIEWRDAVFRFCDRIRNFYDNAEPKDELEDAFDRNGWAEFWKEWELRRQKQYVVTN